MIPAIDYQKASSIDEALNLLSNGDDVKLLAGGHSLIPAMKLGLSSPDKLVDISSLADLNYIKEEDNYVCIGACSTHNDIISSSLVADKLPIMIEAGGMIGDNQVRNKGTIGGSLAHADPAADWPAVLLVCDAEIVIQNSGGSRTIAAADFFTGLFETALEDGELITEIRIPVPPDGSKGTYLKFMQPASRFAIVGCAVLASGNGSFDDVRVAFTGVSLNAFRDKGVENAINGQARDSGNIENAANAAAEDVEIMGDHYASEGYRKHLAKVFAKRALEAIL